MTKMQGRTGPVAAGLIAGATLALTVVGFDGSSAAANRTSDDAMAAVVHASPARGITRPGQVARLTTDVEGTLTAVDVREGQHVSRGDRIGLIDDAVARKRRAVSSERAAGRGAIRQAEAELERAMLTLEQVKRSHERRGATDHELDLARIDVLRAKADLQAAQESHRVAVARDQHEWAIVQSHAIRAPFDGEVVRVEAAPGETLTNSTPFVTIASTTTLRADVHAPLAWYGSMEVGDTVMLAGDAPVDGRIEATIVFIDPVVDPASRTFRCVLEIDNADGELPAGFAVEIVGGADSIASVDGESARGS